MRRWTYYTKGFSMMLMVVSILGLIVVGAMKLDQRADRINGGIITITTQGKTFQARRGSLGWSAGDRSAIDLSTGHTVIFTKPYTISGPGL